MTQTVRQKVLDILLLTVLAIGIWVGVKKLFFLLFPILMALLFSEAIRKSFRRLHPISETVKRILIVLILLIFFSFLSLLVILLVDRLIRGISSLSTGLGGQIDTISAFIQTKIEDAERFFSQMLKRDLEDSLTTRLPTLFQEFWNQILSYVPGWIAQLAEFVPRFFVSLFIFILCTYYFSCDWKRISAFLSKKIKPETTEKIRRTKERFFRGLHQYTKAYLLLFFLTFSELFLGLSVLGIPSPLGKALVIALIDILPIFGCGTVLIPWALIYFALGSTSLAIKLLILCAIIFAVRHVAEPKILGDSIGLHPILSLLLVLGGLALFGFFGMIFLPLLATCLFGGVKSADNKKSP